MALVAPHADLAVDVDVDVMARRVEPRGDPAGRAGIVAWCAVVVVALVWGTVAVRSRDVGLHAAPFKGHWAWHGGWRLLPAVALGAAVTVGGPRMARRLPWRRVPAVAGIVATAWTTALALGDGVDRITAPLTTRFEYEPFAAGIRRGDLGPFVATYVDRLDTYPIHVQGHPPGAVVLAWGLDRIGLGGAGWLAAVSIGAWGVAVAATLVTARTVAGESAARRVAPALAVLPAAVWTGTSVDPIFAALGAVAVALAVQPRTPAAAAGAGVALGVALLCSYGVVPLVVVLVVAALVAHRGAGARTTVLRLGLVGGGALAVLSAAALAGFWWPAGLEATRTAYWDGIGSHRPGLYTTLAGNPAALAVALGPAAAVGLARLAAPARASLATVTSAGRNQPTPIGPTDPPPTTGQGGGATAGTPAEPLATAGRRGAGPLAGGGWRGAGLGALVGGAVVAVVAADLSQMARGEVERIWLPFVPWLALAAPGDRRGWLAAQVVVALAVQSFLVSPW